MNLPQSIGSTPLVKLEKFSSSGVEIWAKLEGSNPGGSIKDRIALYMLSSARQSGALAPSKTIIEATSGNTGIGLAMLAAFWGYRFTAVMPDNVSRERSLLLKAYGADLVLTPGELGTNHAIAVAQKKAEENPERYFMPDQFNNPANPQAHYETTGPEIIAAKPDLTHLVAGMGTGGTLMGLARRLKEYDSKIKIVGVEPKRQDTALQGLRNMGAYAPGIFDPRRLDEKLSIDEEEAAFQLSRELCRREGISSGISSGAALWGALEIARNLKSGIIVVILPDRGDRYLSAGLYAG